MGVGLLVIAIGAEKSESIFAVERVDGDGEVGDLAAENSEFLNVGAVEQRVGAPGLAERDLLAKRRRLSGAEVVADTAALALVERGAGLEIHASAQGINAAVGSLALGELERFEHVAGKGGHARVAILSAEGGHAAAVDRDGGHAGAHAAHADDFDDFVTRVAESNAGQTDREFGGVHVRHVAELIHRRDVLEVVGVALLGQRGREALFGTGDFERVEHEHRAAQDEVADGWLAGGDDDGDGLGVEADIGGNHVMGAGGHVHEVTAGVVDEGAQVERGDLHLGADEAVAGGFVGHVTDHDPGRGAGGRFGAGDLSRTDQNKERNDSKEERFENASKGFDEGWHGCGG